ncbi:hypothetical protein ACHRV1_24670, partial [Flavobacterium aquidurense]
MRNFTLSQSKFFRLISLVLFLLLINYNASAQFFKTHYIAPAPWQYFSKANVVVIATESSNSITVTIRKSNGTFIVNGTVSKGNPYVYRWTGDPKDFPVNPIGQVVAGRGLIVTSDGFVSVNIRNIMSDAINGYDQYIKGNASLTSFGDAGKGVEFRVGYYRDGDLFGIERPIYSVMGIEDNTVVKINGSNKATLNAGESYLFNAPIGTLVETTKSVVMNTSARVDAPEACGDGTFDQLPPVSVLGTEYFIERGKGNNTAEQTTVVTTKPGTNLTIDSFGTAGNLVSTVTKSFTTAGQSYTFQNGSGGTAFTATRIFANENVAVYSGTADRCEVDISTIAPVSACGGSKFIETTAFLGYNGEELDYFGYVLLRSATDEVKINNLTLQGLTFPRRQLGSTGWYIIDFDKTKIGSPAKISISSNSKLTVSIAQQGNGYSMAAFFSNFAQQPSPPKETYAGVGSCLKKTATLTADPGFLTYVWRYNGVVQEETSNVLTVTKTGSYTVTSQLSCGVSSESTPIVVTLCSDVAVENKVDVTSQCVGANVVFTVTARNLGPSNAEGVSVTDKLPVGLTVVSSLAPAGTSYDSTTGIWTISGLDNGASAVLTITARVNTPGNYNSTATITSSNGDDPTGNNTAKVSVTAIQSVAIAAFSPTTSTRCQGAGTVTYITTATNSTGIIYSLDSASLAGGNTINGASGVVTYAAAWSGKTTITASAAGCNEPATTTHVVTVNAFAGAANNTTSNAAICSGATKTLSATPAGGTWSIVLGGGSILSTTYTAANVTADTNVTIKYSAPASGSCPATTSDVTFTVNPDNSVSVASATPTLCINTVLTNITHTTTGATGIGLATGLPSGVTA